MRSFVGLILPIFLVSIHFGIGADDLSPFTSAEIADYDEDVDAQPDMMEYYYVYISGPKNLENFIKHLDGTYKLLRVNNVWYINKIRKIGYVLKIPVLKGKELYFKTLLDKHGVSIMPEQLPMNSYGSTNQYRFAGRRVVGGGVKRTQILQYPRPYDSSNNEFPIGGLSQYEDDAIKVPKLPKPRFPLGLSHLFSRQDFSKPTFGLGDLFLRHRPNPFNSAKPESAIGLGSPILRDNPTKPSRGFGSLFFHHKPTKPDTEYDSSLADSSISKPTNGLGSLFFRDKPTDDSASKPSLFSAGFKIAKLAFELGRLWLNNRNATGLLLNALRNNNNNNEIRNYSIFSTSTRNTNPDSVGTSITTISDGETEETILGQLHHPSANNEDIDDSIIEPSTSPNNNINDDTRTAQLAEIIANVDSLLNTATTPVDNTDNIKQSNVESAFGTTTTTPPPDYNVLTNKPIEDVLSNQLNQMTTLGVNNDNTNKPTVESILGTSTQPKPTNNADYTYIDSLYGSTQPMTDSTLCRFSLLETAELINYIIAERQLVQQVDSGYEMFFLSEADVNFYATALRNARYGTTPITTELETATTPATPLMTSTQTPMAGPRSMNKPGLFDNIFSIFKDNAKMSKLSFKKIEERSSHSTSSDSQYMHELYD